MSDYPNFSEQWKKYGTRDKILYVCSFLIFLVFTFFSLINLPYAHGSFIHDFIDTPLSYAECSEFKVEYDPNANEEHSHSGLKHRHYDKYNDWVNDCEISIVYIFSPIFLAVSTVSMVIYALVLFINRDNSPEQDMPSATYASETWIGLSGGFALSILLLLIFTSQMNLDSGYGDENGDVVDLFKGIRVDLSESSEWYNVTQTDYSWTINGNSHKYTYSGYFIEKDTVDLLTYLYLPNLIGVLSLGFFTRRVNDKENTDFIEEFGYQTNLTLREMKKKRKDQEQKRKRDLEQRERELEGAKRLMEEGGIENLNRAIGIFRKYEK